MDYSIGLFHFDYEERCTPMDSPHMAEQKQDGQLEHTYSSSVRIRDVALKTCQRRWTIGRSGERRSGISVLAAWHDDDDDDEKRKGSQRMCYMSERKKQIPKERKNERKKKWKKKKKEKRKKMLYTVPMNINGYVPFSYKYVGHYCEWGGNMLIQKQWFTFFTPQVRIVFYWCYKDFHFISNFYFGYFSFSYLLIGYNWK